MPENDILQLVSFEVGKEMFAMPVERIQEIIRLTEVVSIPKSPDFVEGVINLRGYVIPVVDLKKVFAVEAHPDRTKMRIIVVEVENFLVGLMVDSVSEVVRFEEKDYQEAPSLVVNISQRFVKGIIKKSEEAMLIVLDVDRLFTAEETSVLKDVG